jgi:hypothetical protein
MSNDAQRFRRRAIDCRNISKVALNVEDRWMLEEIADELDVEARRMEAAAGAPLQKLTFHISKNKEAIGIKDLNSIFGRCPS